MSFIRRNELGDPVRVTTAVIDCSNDEPLTEQHHKKDVDINQIIKKHGMDMIAQTSLLQSREFQFDDVTGNDFQEAMEISAKAEQSFNSLPSQIRKKFDNSPAQFLDFVQNPSNQDAMIELGLAQRIEVPPPIAVTVTNEPTAQTNPETPPV